MFLPPIYETEEHAQLRAQARRFAERHIAPHALEWEEAAEFPRSLYRDLAEAGLLGVGYPEACGGSGGDASHAIACAEELIVWGKSVGTVAGLGGDKIAALAITEPGCGSDVAAVATRAVRDGNHYVVNGAKTFITSGCRADLVTTAVRTGGPGHGGISLLVIERGTPGFVVGRKLKKTGWWPSDTAELAFEDCRVPVANRIGAEDAGFVPIMQNFVSERLALAASCVAIGMLAYRESVAWARERHAFGKPLVGFQVTRHKLAEMATRIAAARALMHELVQRHLRSEADPALAAMTKNTASDMCSFVCDEAVQIHGGYGYVRETVVERLFRDARIYPIGGGTREIMNEIISKLGQDR